MLIRRSIYLVTLCLMLSNSHEAAVAKVRTRTIPVAKGLASHPVNGGRCLISDGEYQYIAFYDGDHQMTMGKRRLSETKWDFARLPERVGWDTHNKIVLFRDREGYLHLTGNMHCGPLRYYRTRKAGDIHTFEGIHTWTGDYENRVTYPTVFKLRDGSIYLMYRHGGSGNGMRILLHYDEDTQRWTKTTPILTNGMNRKPTCNAYPIGLLEDKQGTWHIAWCWRETPDVITNFDICYAKSTDRGTTWKGWDGRDLELPITPENAHVVESIKQDNGLMNGGSFAVDDQGRPYVGYTRFDKEGYNQLYLATPVGGGWKVIQLTDWKHRFYFHGRGTIPESPPTPRISITIDQKIRVSYSNRHEEIQRGQLILTREQLLTGKPDQYAAQRAVDSGPKIPNIRAVNRGPLPTGVTHYMQQQTDSPNRDRKPEGAREPTMIYIVEVKNRS
ncbi:MAG: BNR repeat-containing protein [Phycisphaerales bacterium]|nr:MAG: BNR repeat-containing protein [Phycisphaerales bacterium]